MAKMRIKPNTPAHAPPIVAASEEELSSRLTSVMSLCTDAETVRLFRVSRFSSSSGLNISSLTHVRMAAVTS